MPHVQSDGPFVNIATLCRARHRQPDGTVELIGVIRNRLVMDSAFLDRLEAREVRLVAVVTLDGGQLRGTYPLALRTRYPGGVEAMLARLVEFTDEAPQVTMEMPVIVAIDRPGEYCVDVLFDRRSLTKIVVQTSPAPREFAEPPSVQTERDDAVLTALPNDTMPRGGGGP